VATFLVEYTFSPGTAAIRDETRTAHRAWLAGLCDDGILKASGPFPDGLGALLIFRAEDEAAVKALIQDDPYVPVSAIDATSIRPWNPVIGPISD
jgi:uncharacterized protein YciI